MTQDDAGRTVSLDATSERIADPLSTFLVGAVFAVLPFAGLPGDARAARIAELVRNLKQGDAG